MKDLICQIIDLFYPPFRRWIPLQTFRYIACGGFSTGVDISLFYICLHYILPKDYVHLLGFTFYSYVAALFMALCISFPTGFVLSKFIVFPESKLRSRVQLFRYFLLVAVCIVLNYVFLKFFVGWCHFYPTIGKICTTVLVACFSFLTQRHFTFYVKGRPVEASDPPQLRL